MDFSAAYTSAKAALALLGVAIKARDDAKITEATVEVRKQVFAMSELAMAYIEKNAALVAENAALKLAQAEQLRARAQLEDQIRERANYALHEVRPGVFVYQYQPAVEGAQAPAHYLCQACYDNGVKSVLQGSSVLHCLVVKGHSIRIADRPQPPRRMVAPFSG